MGIEGTERVETVIVGGGQAGLATGYFLQRDGRPAVILDAYERVGDAWRTRWDSLRLFTLPATMPCPASASPRQRGHSRRRMRWLTTWRRTPNGSGSKSGPAATCRRSPGTGIGSSSRRRRSDRSGQRRRGDRWQSGSAPARLRERARPIDRAAALEPVPPAVAARRRRRPDRRRGELGSRHRARGRADARTPGSPGRSRDTSRSGSSDRGSTSSSVIRFFGTTCSRGGRRSAGGPAQSPREGRPVDPSQAQGPPRCRRGTGRAGGGGSGRPSDDRGRTDARRDERDLVHGVPHRLLVDRPAGTSGRTASRCTTAA